MKQNSGKPKHGKRKWQVIMGEGMDDDCPLCRQMREDMEKFGEPIVAFPALDPEELRELFEEPEE